MKMTNQFLAGSALCLLMAAPIPAKAEGFDAGAAGAPSSAPINATLMLAQLEAPAETGEDGSEPAEGGECPSGTIAAPDGECVPAEEEPAAEEAAPPEETPAEAAPDQPAEQEPAEDEASPEQAPAEEAPAEEPPADVVPEPAPRDEEPADTQAEPETPAAEEPPAEQAPPEAAPEQPAEGAPETEEPADMQAEPEGEPAQAEPESEAPAAEEPAGEADEGEVAPEQDATPPAEEAPADTGAADEEPAEEGEAPATETQQPADADSETPAEAEGQAGEGEDPADAQSCPPGRVFSGEDGGCVVIDQDVPLDEQPADQSAPAEEQVPGEADAEAGEEEPLPDNAAPVLDSQKEGAADAEAAPEEGAPQETEASPEEAQEPDGEVTEEAAEEAPVPESDEQAQQNLVDPQELQTEIRAIVEEEGQPIELGQTPEDRRVRRAEFYQRRENARVVEEYRDNRTIVEINNNIYVESPDYDRLVRRDDRVYYEELRGGRVREVIERPNGTRVITIRNRYGDVVRRVRVTPDGREHVLVYVPEGHYDEVRYFEDPARDLPPLRLTIPVSEYILEADRVEDPDRYYTFLHQPPVEPVRRLYSVEEVKYSARVRDMVRRIDLDTIEFEFGSARIEESEIADLESVADAILRMLDENPAETFLIEGHTDAVGSETANLALSDRRAEAVARGLTDVFDVPPENLVTQGYGEQYLKIQTQEPERENRRVAVRRITPLVSPVASRQ